VEKCAANVEILLAAGHEDQCAGAIDGDAQRGDPNDRSSLHKRRIVEPLDGLPNDGAHSYKQEESIEERRQNGSPLPSISSARTRNFFRQFTRGPGHNEAEHVGEVVAGIGQKGERFREQAEGNLKDYEAYIKENPDQKRPPEIRRRMMLMAMFVMVVAHAQSAP
jgi:hypothetical protein